MTPHAVCIPYPAQGHITPMLYLSKLLHSVHGFHITFVNTHYNHDRIVRARGPDAVSGVHGFRFASIPDGLPPTSGDVTQDIPSLCDSTAKNCLAPFLDLLLDLRRRNDVPPVSCIISDGAMSFTLEAAEQLGLPIALFWTTSACGFMAYLHCQHLIDRGIVPFKQPSNISSDGELDADIDWVPGMEKIMKLKDFPSFIRTTDPNDIMLNFVNREASRASMARAVILNTFYELEHEVIDAMKVLLPSKVYTIGPLSLLTKEKESFSSSSSSSLRLNLWKEESYCLEWLDDDKPPGSVVYINFGSITVMSAEQMAEFAWGLALSRQKFLWIVRPDLVGGSGDSEAGLPEGFLKETEGRGLLASWCPQDKVLEHPAVGGFLTHCGWNSTIESLAGGVPMLCWPFFAEQQTNCRYSCTEWGVGMEIAADVRREEVAAMVGELMASGEADNRLRRMAKKWKERAVRATQTSGSSAANFDKLVNEVLLPGARNQE